MIPNLMGIVQLHEVGMQYKVIEVAPKDFEADHIVKEIVYFCGMFTPMKATMVDRKPENERRWNWRDLVTTEDIPLDSILLGEDGIEYKIQSKDDWSQAEYFHYTCAEQPKGLDTNTPPDEDDDGF